MNRVESRRWSRVMDGLKRVLAIAMITQQLTPPLTAFAALNTTGRWVATPSLGFSSTHTVVLREPGTNATRVFMFGESGAPQTMKFWRMEPGDTNLILPTTSSPRSSLISLPHPNGLATDLFCSGHATLPDGRMVLVGGAWIPLSPCREVYTLDPAWQPGVPSNPTPWTESAQMAVQRWYATATTLPDGKVLASAGTMSSGMIGFGGLAVGATMDTTWRVLQPLELATRFSWGDTTAAPGSTCTSNCTPARFAGLRLNDNYTAGQYPPGRDMHAFVGDYGGRAIVFGGRTRKADGTFEVLGDAWHLYASQASDDTSRGWSLLEQVGDTSLPAGEQFPVARWGCAATWAGVEDRQDTRLQEVTGAVICFIHGGVDASGNVLGDLWRGERRQVDGPHYQWHWKRVMAGDATTRRFGHSMVFDPGAPGISGALRAKVVIYGGWTSTTTLAAADKLHAVGVGTLSNQPGVWRELTAGGTAIPPARAWQGMTPKWRDKNDDEREYFMFGGEAGASSSSATPVASNMWVLERHDAAVGDEDAFSWKQLVPDGQGPTGRSRPGMGFSLDADAVVVVGGDTTGSAVAGGQSDAIWTIQARYAGNTITWRKPLTRSFHPAPPPIAGMAFVSLGAGKARIARSMEQFSTAANSSAGADCGPLHGQWQVVTEPTSTSERPIADYPNMYVMPDGRLFNAGPAPSIESNSPIARYKRFFDLQSKQWTDGIVGDQYDNILFGTSAMYRPGKVLRAGSTGAKGADSTQTVEVLLGQSPAWVSRSDLDPKRNLIRRTHHNLTLLPTGDVLASGGVDDDNLVITSAVRRPQLWYSDLGRWSNSDTSVTNPELLAQDPWIRNYHSTAVLLPDARILTAGGESPSPNADQTSASVFEPPYLFRDNGSYAARPGIMTGPDLMPYGYDYTVLLTDSARCRTIRSVALLRPGAATHGFDQGQRYVPLEYEMRAGPRRLLVKSPANANLAPPGDYLLFVVDSLALDAPSVPSVARWVRLAHGSFAVVDSGDVTAPIGGGALGVSDFGCAGANTLHVGWTAPADDSLIAFSGPASAYTLRYTPNAGAPADWNLWSLASTGTPAAMGSVESSYIGGVSANTWYKVGLKAKGDNNDLSGLSNTVVVKALECGGGGGGYQEGDGLVAKPGSGAFAASPNSMTGGTTMASDNTALPGVAPGVESSDLLRFEGQPRLVGGARQVYVREAGSRGLSLDRVELLAVDHGPGLEVVPTTSGSLQAGTRVGAASLIDPVGGTGAIISPDASRYPIYADSGAVVLVELSQAPAGSDDLMLIESGYGSVGGDGILIDAMDASGGWIEVATVYPRQGWSTMAVPLAGQTSLRLRCRDAVAVRFVGRLVTTSATLVHAAPLAAASDNHGITWLTEVTGDDSLSAVVAPHDTLSLMFDDVPPSEGLSRAWFLRFEGAALSPQVAMFRAGQARREVPEPLPTSFRLHQNVPNPFAQQTAIGFELPRTSHVVLDIFDPQGRRVRRFAGAHAAGVHRIMWDMRDEQGEVVSPGIYAYRLTAGGQVARRKMVVIP